LLSYRHGYHAGNYADLLKHFVQTEILQYMCKKDKPFDYIDTHAGAGMYRLDSGFSAKNSEYKNGISHYYPRSEDTPEELNNYVEQIASRNSANKLRYYPGSPCVAENFLRHGDKAWLFELHGADCEVLDRHFEKKRQVRVRQEDGFEALIGLLPCQSRRAFVLIDPPYEKKADYRLVVDTIIKAHQKMPSTTFALWYPVVQRERIQEIKKRLIRSKIRNIVQFELGVTADTEDYGMTSAGMIVINPPWTLTKAVESVLPSMAKKVSEDGEPHFIVEQWVAE